MAYEKVPNQTGQNFPVSTQYGTHPGTSVNALVSPQYQTFPSGDSAPNLALLVSSVPVVLYVNAASGVTLDDDTLGVTGWEDQSGNGNHYVNLGADALLPLWSATGGPGGRPCISSDATFARFIANPNWNPPAPLTTNIYVRMIVRLNSWNAASRHIMGGTSANRLAFRTVTAANGMCIFNATAASPTVQMAPGTWFLVEYLFTGSTSDSLEIGAQAPGTGVNTGNNDQTSHALFSITTGATGSCADCSIEEVLITSGTPSAGERAAMTAANQAWLGPATVTY